MGYFEDYNGYAMQDDYTDVALICENGHVVNDSMNTFPEYNGIHCEECGAKNISVCPSCAKPIDGKRHMSGVMDISTMTAPKFCKHCGKPYPWTEAKIKAIEELVDLMDELDENEKLQLKETATIISTDNPRTQVGVLKIKKYLGKVGKSLGETAQKVFVDLASETAVKLMKEQGMI